jgi:hypothetical protein
MPPIGAPKNYAAVRNAAVRRAAKRKPRQSAGIPAASDRPATRAADFRRAAAFKRTPTYHQAVRSAYGNATIRQRQADLVAAAKHRTPEGGDVALVHNRRAQIDANDIAKYGHVIRGANRQEARTLAQLDRRGKIAALKEFGPGTRQIVPEPQLPHFSQAQLAQMRASALPEHHSFLHSLLSKGGGATKSSVLWALKQLSRPGAAIAAGALEGKREEQAPGGFLNTGKVLSAMGQGFTDPYSHMHDWNEYYRRMGVKPKIPNEVLSFATAVGTDPTTYLTAGAGGVAKNAALHTYEDALAKGLSEKEAVAAARKVWAKAPHDPPRAQRRGAVRPAGGLGPDRLGARAPSCTQGPCRRARGAAARGLPPARVHEGDEGLERGRARPAPQEHRGRHRRPAPGEAARGRPADPA